MMKSPFNLMPVTSCPVRLYIREDNAGKNTSDYFLYEVDGYYDEDAHIWSWEHGEESFQISTEEDLTKKGCRVKILGWEER